MHKIFFSSDLILDVTFYENSTINGYLKNPVNGSSLQFTGLSVSGHSNIELAFFIETKNPSLISSFAFGGRIENDHEKQIMFLDWIEISDENHNPRSGTFTFISDSTQVSSVINFDEQFALFKVVDEVLIK